MHGLQAVNSVANSFHTGEGAKFQKTHPKTATAIAAVPIAIVAGGVAVGAYGGEAVGGFIANEIKDEILSQATGGASDVLDITKAGAKMLRNIATSLDDVAKNLKPRCQKNKRCVDVLRIFLNTNIVHVFNM